MNDITGNTKGYNAASFRDRSDEVSGIKNEALERLGEILKKIWSEPEGEDLCGPLLFELQAISEGKSLSADEVVIDRNDLDMLLYAENPNKSEIRRIIASVIHRARILLKKSPKTQILESDLAIV